MTEYGVWPSVVRCGCRYDIAQMLPARSIKAGNYQLSEGPRDPPAKQTIVLDIDNVVALANQIF